MLLHLLVSVGLLDPGVHAIIHERLQVSLAVVDVPVNGVVANVDLSVGIPPLKVLVRLVDNGRWFLDPYQLIGLLGPELFLVFHGGCVLYIVQLIREVVRHGIVNVLVLFFGCGVVVLKIKF